MVGSRLHATLHEHAYALALVARAPGWIRVRASEVGWSRKRVQAVVKLGMEIFQALTVCEAFDCAANAFIEIKDDDLRWPIIHDIACLQIRNTDTDRISIPYECELLAVGPASDEFTLQHHIAGFHINLVKDAQRQRSVLDHI